MSGVQEGFISCNKRVGLAASLRGTYYLVLVQKPIDLTLDSDGDLSVDGDANSLSQDRVSMAYRNELQMERMIWSIFVNRVLETYSNWA